MKNAGDNTVRTVRRTRPAALGPSASYRAARSVPRLSAEAGV